jgi:uncharacterized protein YecE (DUF72 family)
MIQVGTSGFSYKDWVGPFYPPGTADRTMLEYYATRYDLLELDYTYYTMPAQRTMISMCTRTPEGFTFCIKAHKSMTHEVSDDSAEVKATFARFMDAVAPMIDAGKLGCILVQFPWSFRPSAQNATYVAGLRELLPNVPVTVEFRNTEWVQERTFSLLRRSQLGFCCVDEPRLRGLFPPLTVATSDMAYVRFHGRNAAKWWKHEQPWERYDYLYRREELMEWIPRIRALAEQAERTLVLFNNCHAGQAATNADMLKQMLLG